MTFLYMRHPSVNQSGFISRNRSYHFRYLNIKELIQELDAYRVTGRVGGVEVRATIH